MAFLDSHATSCYLQVAVGSHWFLHQSTIALSGLCTWSLDVSLLGRNSWVFIQVPDIADFLSTPTFERQFKSNLLGSLVGQNLEV